MQIVAGIAAKIKAEGLIIIIQEILADDEFCIGHAKD